MCPLPIKVQGTFTREKSGCEISGSLHNQEALGGENDEKREGKGTPSVFQMAELRTSRDVIFDQECGPDNLNLALYVTSAFRKYL